ncbi:DJ-1/PfpI family protein, partial [Streptomyces sp. NPDC127106]|uniref:DJ-1/PfpI family protein n=1 Tax=Streptomyces sp. NPDC127106 TaxID=3345360 RepID=UPI00362F0C06
MQTAVLLYPGFTALDAVGPYETLVQLPDSETVFVAERPGPVRCDSGRLSLVAEKGLDEVTRPDVVVVPGGPHPETEMDNPAVLDWLRTVDATTTWTTSVCTGSLLLAAGGGGRAPPPPRPRAPAPPPPPRAGIHQDQPPTPRGNW